MEIMATDAFNALQLDPVNEMVREQYNATRRLQLSYAKELGLTPGARAGLAATVTQAVGLAAQLAQRRAVMEGK
jgi:phage terminase small subunit